MDVLVIGDEALLRAAVRENLRGDGLEVAEAPSAEEALSLAEVAGAPRVVIADMPPGAGMDDLILIEEARRHWPEAGVVIMAGAPLALHGCLCGEREHLLAKPFGPSRLVATVRQLMGWSER